MVACELIEQLECELKCNAEAIERMKKRNAEIPAIIEALKGVKLDEVMKDTLTPPPVPGCMLDDILFG